MNSEQWYLDWALKDEIQYLHSQSRSDKQFRTLQVNRSTHVQIASLFPRFLFRCYPPHRNIHSTTILVHRRKVHMWRWFHGLMSLVWYKQTWQASAILRVQNSDVESAVLRNLESSTPTTTKNKRTAFYDSVPSPARVYNAKAFHTTHSGRVCTRQPMRI